MSVEILRRELVEKTMSKKNVSYLQKVREWYNDCALFAEEVLAIKLTHNQRHILKIMSESNKIAIKSCNSSGKTFLFSIVTVWFFFTRICLEPEKSTIVIFTSPVFSQLQTGIFLGTKKNIKTASKVLSKKYGIDTSLFGKEPSEDMNNAKFFYNDESYMLGIASKSSNDIVSKHADNVLVLQEEAQGLSEEVFSGFKGILSSGKCKQVMIGNTTLTKGCQGRYYEAFQDDSEFSQITITSFDTPNFILPDIKAEDYLKDENDYNFWRNKLDRYCGTNYKKAKLENKIGCWEDAVAEKLPVQGLASPIGVNSILQDAGYNFQDYEAKTRIFAEFPDSSGSATYPLPWIKNSKELWHDESQHIPGKKYLGVDFGRGVGKDKSAFAYVDGNKCMWIKEYNLDTIGILDKVDEIKLEFGFDAVKIENNGEGIHFARLMRERGHKVLEIDVGSVPGYGKTDKQELKEETEKLKKLYKLKRDETWFNLRDRINPNRVEGDPIFLLPPDPDLEKQMRASTYTRESGNLKIRVDSKDVLRKRLKRSTDKLDALLAALSLVDDEDDDFNIDGENLYFFSYSENVL